MVDPCPAPWAWYRRVLDAAVRAKADYVELNPRLLRLLCGGSVQWHETYEAGVLATQRGLGLTLHLPNHLSLASVKYGDRYRAAFWGYMQVADAVDAPLVVYHTHAASPRRYRPSQDNYEIRRQSEVTNLRYLADNFPQITIVVENHTPQRHRLPLYREYGWEDYVTADFNVRRVAELVADVDRPNVGMCLDVGHAALASTLFGGGNVVQHVESVLPYVKHVHIHDNFGEVGPPTTFRHAWGEEAAVGFGDLHLPLGEGTLPLGDMVDALLGVGYRGKFTIEIKEHFLRDAAVAASVAWLRERLRKGREKCVWKH